MGLIIAALVGVALLAVPGSPAHKKVTLGLDLQGGLEVVLKAEPEKGQTFTAEDLDRSVEIMRSRVDKIGVAEPEIRKQGKDQIVIELPGVHNQERAAQLIGKTAKLELYDLQGDLTGPSRDAQGFPRPMTSIFALLTPVQSQTKEGEPGEFYLVKVTKKGDKTTGTQVGEPAQTRKALLAPRKGHLKKGFRVLAVPEHMVVVTCTKDARYCPGVNAEPSQTYYYLFKYDPQNKDKPIPEMTGSDLKLKGTRQDFDTSPGGGGGPIVLMQFTKEGGDKFHDITSELARRGRLVHNRIGGTDEQAFQQFAIVLDREIRSAPTIDYNENPDGIPVAFLYGAVLLINATLTLPGFAGLILTIGVAADANVVVFERIKEEARAGKSVRAAIAAGYAKGFHTIIDANVVTAITALVLFLVATAGVKGFALMLLIGTGISLITAVAATRAMLGLLAGFRWFDTPQPQLVEDVRSDAQSIDPRFAKAVIQGRGKQTNGKYQSFQLRTKSLTSADARDLRNGLQSKFKATHYGAKNVSESFGRQIARSAIIAILFSLFLIVLYVALRFDLKYAGPVIAALIHDVVVTIGVYSLTGREVSVATVAAVLTVLGYSIYDTIIIFDRIRENVPLMRRASFATIANVSLWETIRRSLATTFITLLPVGSLLIFGGATLKDFAFALLIGTGSGAYSSIFIAAPLLTIWKEREPEYARRVGSTEVSGGV